MRKLIILMYAVIIIGLIYIVRSIAQPENRAVITVPAQISINSNFDLVNTQGMAVSSKDFLGKIMLVYFGFTYCPDICPAELQKISNVIDSLKDHAKYVQPIFITIDPERDNLIQLKSYMDNFNPAIIALGGNEDRIKKAAENYKVYYNKINNDGNKNYMIDHSSLMYLIDYKGQYITNFNINTKAKDIENYIRNYIDQLPKQG